MSNDFTAQYGGGIAEAKLEYDYMELWLSVASALPLTSCLAVCFYIWLVSLTWRPVCDWMLPRLAMPSPSTQSNLSVLDSFRGLAALWVAAFHWGQWSYPFEKLTTAVIDDGNKAVAVFAVLSGFLIWRSLLRVESIADFRRYCVNRFIRIFPLYFVVTSVLFILKVPEAREVEYFLSDMVFARAIGSSSFSLPQAWSLYAEVLFYCVCPILALGVSRWHMPILLFLLLSLIMAVPSTLREFVLWRYFLMGIIVCHAEDHYGAKIGEIAGAFLAGAGLVIFGVDVLGKYDWFTAFIYRGYNPGLPSFTVGLGVGFSMFMFGCIHSTVFSKIFSIRPLRILGAVSFSVFIWHTVLIATDLNINFQPMGTLRYWNHGVRLPTEYLLFVILPAVIFTGILSFLAIERPFLMKFRSGGKLKN